MQCSQHITDEISVADEPICDHTSFIVLLQSRLVNTNSLMVAGLFQILRRILKYVKQGSSDIEEKFILLTLSSLLRMPWNEFSTSQMLTNEENSGTKGLLEERTCLERHSKVLLGSVIQLFCSVVEHKDQEDVGGLKEFSVYVKFTNLVPKLICCFSKQLGTTDQHISGYFRHKVLMLMIRLSYHENWESSCPMLWLKLLRQYFEDLLYERISEPDAAFGNSLDGSPFLPSFSSGNKLHYSCNRNLQRQAIFLLFKCCFTLSRVSKDTCEGCDCAVESWPSACLVQLCGEDCYRRGLSELFQWLQRSDLLEKTVDCEDYFKLCGSFALSFLQLYAEDDDMLLEMLLQLLDAPSFTFHVQNNKNDRPLEELKKDMCLLFSSIFNPIHLFHMFLLVLHYDHSVLIDYLISKDTGIPCVKYLLRCLRIICESWPTFVNFSICGTETNQSCYKRRKITRNKDCSRKSSPFRSTAMVRRQHSGRHKGCSMSKAVNIPTFINAKECLLCLQRSVEEIHQKKLFPYNPKPLLSRLSRFQELCEHEECGARHHR